MQTNIRKIESKRLRSKLNVDDRVFTKKIAEKVPCSVRMVQAVLAGNRGKRSDVAKKIWATYDLYTKEYTAAEERIKNKMKL